MTKYYDVNLKQDRNKILKENENFYSYLGLIQIENYLMKFIRDQSKVVIHLAAQAGVRYSIDNPILMLIKFNGYFSYS